MPTFLSSVENAARVTALCEVLAATPVGGTAGYAALNEAVGRDIHTCRWLLDRAFRRMEREHGAVFSNVRHVGYCRVTVDDLPAVGAKARGHIRRSSRKAQRSLHEASSRANDIAPDVQKGINAELAALGVLEYLAATRERDRLKTSDRVLPTNDAAKMLLEHLNGAGK